MKLQALIRLSGRELTCSFEHYLEEKQAGLSLNLVRHLNRQEEPTAEYLAEALYGLSGKKEAHKLNQLSSDTFYRFLEFLNQNHNWYPELFFSKLKETIQTSPLNKAELFIHDFTIVISAIEYFSLQQTAFSFLFEHYYYRKEYKNAGQFRELADHARKQMDLVKEAGLMLHQKPVTGRKKRKGHEEELPAVIRYFEQKVGEDLPLRLKIDFSIHYIDVVYFLDKVLFETEKVKNFMLKTASLVAKNRWLYDPFPFMTESNLNVRIALAFKSEWNRKQKGQMLEWYRFLLNQPGSSVRDYVTFVWHFLLIKGNFSIHDINLRFESDKFSFQPPPYADWINELLEDCAGFLSRGEAIGIPPSMQAHIQNIRANCLLALNKRQEACRLLEQQLFETQQIQEATLSHVLYINLISAYFYLEDWSNCSEAYERYQRFIRSDISFDKRFDLMNQFYYLIAKWKLAKQTKLIKEAVQAGKKILRVSAGAEDKRVVEYIFDRFKIDN